MKLCKLQLALSAGRANNDPDRSYRFSALSNVDYEVYAEYNGARSNTKTLSGFDTRAQANITLRLK